MPKKPTIPKRVIISGAESLGSGGLRAASSAANKAASTVTGAGSIIAWVADPLLSQLRQTMSCEMLLGEFDRIADEIHKFVSNDKRLELAEWVETPSNNRQEFPNAEGLPVHRMSVGVRGRTEVIGGKTVWIDSTHITAQYAAGLPGAEDEPLLIHRDPEPDAKHSYWQSAVLVTREGIAAMKPEGACHRLTAIDYALAAYTIARAAQEQQDFGA